MKRRAAFFVVAIGSAGCTLLNPLGGYAGPDADPSAPPGTPVDDASDARPLGDAGSDANPGFCAANPGHTLCADFDEVGAVGLGWSDSEIVNVGTTAKSTDAFVSSPFSMAAHAAPSASLAAIGRLRQYFPPSAAHTQLSFDIRMETPMLPGNTEISIGEITCYRSDGSFFDGAWLFWSRRGGASVQFGLYTNSRGAYTLLTAPSPTAWTRYAIDWSQKTVSVVVGSETPITVPVNEPCSAYDSAEFLVGISTQQGGETIDALYDNAVLDVNPP